MKTSSAPRGIIDGILDLASIEATSRRYGGTGLGLAICHEIAGQMGGIVGDKSVVAAGSTFRCGVSWLISLSVSMKSSETPFAQSA